MGFTGEALTERIQKNISNHKRFTGNTGDWQLKIGTLLYFYHS